MSRLAALVQRDPAGRGIAQLQAALPVTCADSLARIVAGLHEQPKAGVALVTGFCIVDAEKPAAETDGPPGALFLAQLLAELGYEVTLISDDFGLPLLKAGCDFLGLPRDWIATVPFETPDMNDVSRSSNDPQLCARTDRWVADFLASDRGRRISQYIAIERVGPSHTPESVAAQAAGDAALLEQFEREVPPEAQNVCHSMRGQAINAYTAKAHRLFEIVHERRLACATIGIGDGGNEIGSGCLPWAVARRAMAGGHGARIASRIATDHFLLAGISDWGAYAVGMALARQFARLDLLARHDAARQGEMIKTIVRETDAVDGMTRRRQATIDGLSIDEYLQTFSDVRALALATKESL